MFVSESKFRSAPADFVPHILNPNPSALLALITKPEVEAALLRRLDKKARWYGAELGPEGDPVAEREPKVQPEEVVRLYEEYIIPLTKDVEVGGDDLERGAADARVSCWRWVSWPGLLTHHPGEQVEYLLHRLDGLSQAEIDDLVQNGTASKALSKQPPVKAKTARQS